MFDDSYYDEIELEYSCFLAEQELFENLLYLGSNVYHESMGLIVIQEDFSTTITKYMDKIVIGIQKAWNNFKNKVIGFASKPILDNSKDKIGTYKDGNITTENWHVYDMNKFDALKMVPFDLKQLEPFQNKTDYYASVYSGFFTDKNKSLKENIIDSIMRTEDKHDVKTNDIQEVYTFCSTGFKERTTKLDADLDAFNASINAVKSAVNITTSGEETSGENQTETSPTAQQSDYKLKEESVNMLLEFYSENNLLLEGPGDDKNNNSQKIINNDKGTPQQKNQIAKIQWYFSGNTDVFSAKMKILRKKYLDGINLLKAAFPKSKETDNTNTSKTGEKVEYKFKTEKQPLQIKK
jgi:hypothetical protein